LLLGALLPRSPPPAPLVAAPALPVASPSGAPTALASPTSSAAPSAAAPGGEALRERAEAGELAALKLLEREDEARRSPEDALALARGHAALALRDLEALVASIQQEPALAHDRSTLARLHRFVEREAIDLEALARVARVPGPESLDLIHAAWRRRGPDAAGLLARDLLRREGALETASAALRAAVELERITEERPARASQRQRRCGRAKEALARVRAEGDRRCLPQLDELERQDGCGGDGREDCYPCLRGGDELKEARQAARQREAPAPWVLPRR
jgi:hypothetical protein